WMTAELGRQPWLIYGLFLTRNGYSKVVSNGSTIFTLIGFTGIYFVLGVLFLYLTGREIAHGPERAKSAHNRDAGFSTPRQRRCSYDRDMVRRCKFHADRLRGVRRSQLRCWSTACVCR